MVKLVMFNFPYNGMIASGFPIVKVGIKVFSYFFRILFAGAFLRCAAGSSDMKNGPQHSRRPFSVRESAFVPFSTDAGFLGSCRTT